jgi:hypothetical protein
MKKGTENNHEALWRANGIQFASFEFEVPSSLSRLGEGEGEGDQVIFPCFSRYTPIRW